MTPHKAVILGFIIAPALPAAYLSLAFPLSEEHDFLAIVTTFVLAYPFSMSAALLFGVPLFLLLRKLNLIRWWSAAISGGVAGGLALFAVRSNVADDAPVLFRFFMLGAGAGLVFWLFWQARART